MVTADQFKALDRSHADADDERFYSVAMQVAARAAQQGQSQFANDLHNLVDSAKLAPAGGVRQLSSTVGQHVRHTPSVMEGKDSTYMGSTQSVTPRR